MAPRGPRKLVELMGGRLTVRSSPGAGHALGLDHNKTKDRLRYDTYTGRSSKLDQYEVDKINPSGAAAAKTATP